MLYQACLADHDVLAPTSCHVLVRLHELDAAEICAIELSPDSPAGQATQRAAAFDLAQNLICRDVRLWRSARLDMQPTIIGG